MRTAPKWPLGGPKPCPICSRAWAIPGKKQQRKKRKELKYEDAERAWFRVWDLAEKAGYGYSKNRKAHDEVIACLAFIVSGMWKTDVATVVYRWTGTKHTRSARTAYHIKHVLGLRSGGSGLSPRKVLSIFKLIYNPCESHWPDVYERLGLIDRQSQDSEKREKINRRRKLTTLSAKDSGIAKSLEPESSSDSSPVERAIFREEQEKKNKRGKKS